MIRENDGLDAATIIQRCNQGVVPINVPQAAAIAAHRLHPTANTLQAVITADTRRADECRALIDYLDQLPISAWQDPDIPMQADLRRSAVLEMIRRSIAWSETCV